MAYSSQSPGADHRSGVAPCWSPASNSYSAKPAGARCPEPDVTGGTSRSGESAEDQDAAGTLARAQRVERSVQFLQTDAAGDQLVEQQTPRQIVADQRGHVALQVGRPEIAAPDDLLVDEAPALSVT